MLILVAVSVSILVESDLIGAAEKAGNAYKTAYEQDASGKITIGNKVYNSLSEYIAELNGTGGGTGGQDPENPDPDDPDPITPTGNIRISKTGLTENSDGTVTIELQYKINDIPEYNPEKHLLLFIQTQYLANKSVDQLLEMLGVLYAEMLGDGITSEQQAALATPEGTYGIINNICTIGKSYTDFKNFEGTMPLWTNGINNQFGITEGTNTYYLRDLYLSFLLQSGKVSEAGLFQGGGFGGKALYAKQLLPELEEMEVESSEGVKGIKETAEGYMDDKVSFDSYASNVLSEYGFSSIEQAVQAANALLGLVNEDDYAMTEKDVVIAIASQMYMEGNPLVITNPDGTNTSFVYTGPVSHTYTAPEHGNYTFSAAMDDRSGTKIIATDKVENPYEGDEVVIAWALVNGAWTGEITSESAIPANATVTVKLYKAPGTTVPELASHALFGALYTQYNITEGQAYAMVVEGTGSIETVKNETVLPWEEYNIMKGYLRNQTPQAPYYMDYVRDVYVCEGVTGFSGLHGASAVSNVQLASTVKKLGDECFAMCTAIETLRLPNTLEYIGTNTFSWTDITNITLTGSLTYLGACPFDGTSITTLTIPASITQISTNLCYDCPELTEVTILGNVTSIGEDAFVGSPKLTTIKVPSNSVKDLFINGTNYDSSKTTIVVTGE